MNKKQAADQISTLFQSEFSDYNTEKHETRIELTGAIQTIKRLKVERST